MLSVIRKLVESILACLRKFISWLRCLFRGAKTCDIRFSLQGRYASIVDLSAFRITNTVVAIHGAALHAGANITEAQFIAKSADEIYEALESYLDNRMHPGLNHLIILDMEPHYQTLQIPQGSE